MNRRERKIEWQLTGDAAAPWEARVDGERWRIRLNDFRTNLYTLLVQGVAVEELDAWPAAWTRPAVPGIDMNELREFELEAEKFERTKDILPSKLVR